MVRFVYIKTEIFLLPSERREAREALREAGLEQIEIREGEPGEEGEATGEFLAAADGPSPSVADLPDAAEIAQMLSVLIDPESDDDARMDVIGGLTQIGRVSTRTYRSAGVLTNDEGFVLTIGSITFQITVV